MATLERRLEALESKNLGRAPEILILIELVRPGHLGAPLKTGTIDGDRFASEPGESEDEFIARVSKVARERWVDSKRRPLVILRSDDIER